MVQFIPYSLQINYNEKPAYRLCCLRKPLILLTFRNYRTEGFKCRPTAGTAVMVTRLKKLMCILLSLLTFAETVYGQEDCHCPAVVYLHRGMEGKIPCQCDDFSLVSWYRSEEDYDDGESPFIIYDNSETTGPGKISGEYDVGVNGSLIITNVSLMNHGKTYFCAFLRETKGQTVTKSIRVEVLVHPNPPYPVVNGYVNHQHLYLDMRRKGSLHCSMKDVHPGVNLSFTVIDRRGSGSFFLEQGDPKYTQNEDNTYDVTVTSNYTADFSVQTVLIQCRVIDEQSTFFSENTIAEISFPPVEKAFPVVNGGVDNEHVYLEMNRTGELNCNTRSLDPKTSLAWVVMDPTLEDTIRFLNCNTIKDVSRQGMFIVTLKCSYIVEDETVDRVTVQCQVTGSTSDNYPNATIVELLFPRKAQSLPTTTLLTPVINYESASDCQKRTSLVLDILTFIVLLVFSICWFLDKVVTRMRRENFDLPQDPLFGCKSYRNDNSKAPVEDRKQISEEVRMVCCS